jgi:hypothetical protein
MSYLGRKIGIRRREEADGACIGSSNGSGLPALRSCHASLASPETRAITDPSVFLPSLFRFPTSVPSGTPEAAGRFLREGDILSDRVAGLVVKSIGGV